MIRLVVTATLVFALLAGCTRPGPPLDSQLRTLFDVLPGRYAGAADLAMDGSGPDTPIFHKLAVIDAPQFGERTLYYQLSRDSADGPALQMKIFVFDTDPARTANTMRAFVFGPGQASGNIERDPARIAALDPASLMSFPSPCGFTWRAIDGGFEAETHPECVFDSRAFSQKIRPDMRYRIVGDRFEWDETLLSVDGTVIVTTGGALPAWREQ